MVEVRVHMHSTSTRCRKPSLLVQRPSLAEYVDEQWIKPHAPYRPSPSAEGGRSTGVLPAIHPGKGVADSEE
jgi:hypothetical protein